MRILLLLLFLCCLAAAGQAADWPQFRGPAGDGTAPETGVRTNWAQAPPKLLWSVPLTDNGFAGPAVAGGVVYLIDHLGTQDIVRALDLQRGSERWRFAYPEPGREQYGFARATPAVSGGKVYTLSRAGKVYCLDAGTGKPLWSHDLVTDFGGVRPQWDYAMSPLVDGDALILCPGGTHSVLALDRQTGAVRWQGGGSDAPGYATPVAATLAGKKQYVIFAGAALLGVDAQRGALLWRYPWATPLEKEVDTPAARAHFNANAAAPAILGETIFITTGYNHGSALLDLATGTPVLRWESKAMQSQYSSPVVHDGYVYGTSDPHTLVCLNLQTGAAAWTQTGINRGGGVAAAGDLLIALDGARGDALLLRLTPTAYQELGRFTPLGGESRTAPILADGKLLVRNRKTLACYALK